MVVLVDDLFNHAQGTLRVAAILVASKYRAVASCVELSFAGFWIGADVAPREIRRRVSCNRTPAPRTIALCCVILAANVCDDACLPRESRCGTTLNELYEQLRFLRGKRRTFEK